MLQRTEDELRALFRFTDGDRSWPFFEDEDANVTGYGHQDREAFVNAVLDYDRHTSGDDTSERHEARLVRHRYALLDTDGDDETEWTLTTRHPLGGVGRPGSLVGPDDPGAVPITTLWGVR